MNNPLINKFKCDYGYEKEEKKDKIKLTYKHTTRYNKNK